MTESLQRGNALSPVKRQGCVPFIPVGADDPGGSGKWPRSVKGGIPLGYVSSPSTGWDGTYHPRHQLSSCDAKRLREVSQLRLYQHKQPGSKAPEQATGARSPCGPQGRQRRKPPPCAGGFLTSLATCRGTCCVREMPLLRGPLSFECWESHTTSPSIHPRRPAGCRWVQLLS